MDRSTATLYGRSQIFEYAAAALRRDRSPAREPFPIMLLLGPRGAGGTAVLNRLRALGADHPGAFLDLAHAEDVGTIVFAAVYELERQRVSGMRRVRHFPRLGVVVGALSYQGNEDDAAAFLAHIRDSRGSGAFAAMLQTWTDRVAPLLPVPMQPDLARLLSGVLGALISGIKERRIDSLVDSLGGIQRLRTLTGRWRLGLEGHQGQAAQRAVDRLLVTAFVDDLRADFNHGPSATRRPSNSFLLLDDCDGQAAVDFLDHLADTRRAAYADEVPADPLVVFATQHGRLHDDAGDPIASTDPALVYSKPDRNAPRSDHPRLWLPVELSALQRPDVQAMIGSSPRGKVAQDTTFVLALTAGHPAATRLLTNVLATLGTSTFEPPGVLDRDLPDEIVLAHIPRAQRSGTVLDVMIRSVLGLDPTVPAPASDHSAQPPLIAQLALGAATRSFDPDAVGAALLYQRWPDNSRELREYLESRLWLAPEGVASGHPGRVHPRLHPLPTLLLRRWLARFPELWRRVHEGYASYYGNRDNALFLFHTLAQTDAAHRDSLQTVAATLHREISSRSKSEWHLLLEAVTDAPCRLPMPADLSTTVNRIAGIRPEPPDLRRSIARLAVATWLHSDVYLDPHAKLAEVVNQEDVAVSAGYPAPIDVADAG